MAPRYRYYSADLLTGNVLAELPLYGVYANRQLSTTGNFNGTFKLGTGTYIDNDLLDATIPGKTAIYMERDGLLIWGGIVWSRTWAEESKTCGMTAQTFESYFDHIVIDSHFIMQNVEQTIIFRDLINALQAQVSSNIGLIQNTPYPTSGIERTVLIPGYEYHFAQDVVSQLVGTDDGFEYTIDVVASGTPDHPSKLVKVGYPTLSNPTSDLSYDYPGSISNFWWPESGTKGATKAVALGYGSGPTMYSGLAIDGDKLAEGYPAWWQVNSYKNIADRNLIGARARKDLETFGMPYVRGTFELKSDVGVGFTGWSKLGDTVTARVESVRFLGGSKVIESRMIGWELTVADADNTEIIKFVIEGGDVE